MSNDINFHYGGTVGSIIDINIFNPQSKNQSLYKILIKEKQLFFLYLIHSHGI